MFQDICRKASSQHPGLGTILRKQKLERHSVHHVSMKKGFSIARLRKAEPDNEEEEASEAESEEFDGGLDGAQD